MVRINKSGKAGFTLTEIIFAIGILGLLFGGMVGVMASQGKIAYFNQTSNRNLVDAGVVVQRLLEGGADYWGIRNASRRAVSSEPTEVVGLNGSTGWQAVYRHDISFPGAVPEPFSVEEQTLVFNPVDRTLALNGSVIGRNVVDSYFVYNNPTVSVGVQVASDRPGQSLVFEASCTVRN